MKIGMDKEQQNRKETGKQVSAAKVSDFIRTVRILKVSIYAYFTRIRIFRTVSLYVKYRTIRIFGFFTVELRIFPERSWQH